ncbi:uncharacterized protein EV420DRAFT_590404 [Desarmillaria tabescens]|uniref:Zn(2)-C6 fungal-type domain-containing protein n=1 Tax=Armillaria tabescens TaxID=1929756 RepID=A0AA39N2N6_ARMTA|nr:uncharacterized protein EV420DRAFT_590404 [Desarmillaria tabescens]KAK0455253.1 hypothetical protein EV420DRAFT_590404 [Desarmillaria tabescens]
MLTGSAFRCIQANACSIFKVGALKDTFHYHLSPPRLSTILINTMSSTSHGHALQRGQACFHCRRRKMRCDGVRPVCGPCTRARRPDDCQYTDNQGRSRMEILEENIGRVQARIQELENPETAGTSVLLHSPYTQGAASTTGPTRVSTPSPSSRRGHHPDASRQNWWTLPEPPSEIKVVLLDKFLFFASEFGFFLHPTRFRTSALQPAPIGHPSRPLPALLTTAYLWGSKLSGSSTPTEIEKALLARSLSQVSSSLAGNHPQKVIHTIQTECLLAYYFLSSGRFLEGKYHITNAVSLAVSSRIDKIRSDQIDPREITALRAAQDPIEEGERVDACWNMIILDKCWAVALASPTNLVCPSDDPRVQVDTPWPLDIEGYESGGYPAGMKGRCTLNNYLRGMTSSRGNEMSMKSLHVKASLLWERSNDLVGTWKSHMNSQESATFYGAFNILDTLLERVRVNLPPPNQMTDRTPSKMRTLFIIHSLTYTAIIQLHGVFAKNSAESKTKVLLSAQAIFRMVNAVRLGNATQVINPIMGTVWVSASQVILEELTALKAFRLSRSASIPPTDEERGMLSVFENGLRDMMPLGRSCSLLRYHLSQIQEAYSAL